MERFSGVAFKLVRTFSVVTLGVIFFLSTPLFAEVPSSKDTEIRFYEDMIKKDPTSERYRLDYSRFLLQRNDLANAKVHVSQLLKLNPNHLEGQVLQKRILELEKITDPEARLAKVREYQKKDLEQSMSQLKGLSESLKGSALGNGELAAYQKQANERAAKLDAKYQIRSRLIEQPMPTMEGVNENSIAMRYELNGEKEKALALRQELIKKYPNNANFYADYVLSLLRGDRFEQAASMAAEGRKRFEKDVRLQIIQDGFAKMKAATSSEQRATSRLELDQNMMDFALIQSKIMLEKSGLKK